VEYTRDIKPILAKQCFTCHGPEKQRSGLRLDTAAAALQGGDSGPVIVPGKSGQSKLIKAVTGVVDVIAMPPKGPRLSAADIAVLKTWIDQGAKVSTAETPTDPRTPRSAHWAFQTPVRPSVPMVQNPAWVRNPIDRFILARLEQEGLTPSPEADRVTLIRRLSFDLLGLPPAVAEADAFLADPRPDAYEQLVERFLRSPRYGERWGRHWLDQARYADSNGYNADSARSIWKYRDWVIGALNRDLPFDQFVIEQLAGDLLPNATLEQKIATGFHRNSMFNDEGGTDPEQSRDEGLVDRVNTTGTVFLGLTVGCAQCHDHKYDPIAQREYYRLYAFFNNAEDVTIACAPPDVVARRDAVRAQLAALQQELAGYGKALEAGLSAWEKALEESARRRLPPEVQAVLAVPPDRRNAKQQQLLADSFKAQDPGYRERQATIAALRQREPRLVTTLALQERTTPRPTHVHIRGDFLRKGVPVSPGTPAVLPLLSPGKPGAAPNRLDLARWLVDPRNPLTARVAANRVWQQYFGIGLVETENDFGLRGTPPSHPELLDWLATEFMSPSPQPSPPRGEGRVRGWSLKTLHRLIVTSATYRQASHYRPELSDADPRNRLLARQFRLRLEAEVIRDAALAASGLLVSTVGGPSVFPPQPGGLDAFARSKKNWKADVGPNRFRRGMYTHFWRSIPHPSLTVFDATDATTACTRRNRSTTPLQALTLANDQAFFECAQALAGRLLKEAKPSDGERLRYAFRLCLAREPNADESQKLGQWLARQLAPKQGKEEERIAWTQLCRVLLNLDEFITRE
jgi:hypothetical protein